MKLPKIRVCLPAIIFGNFQRQTALGEVYMDMYLDRSSTLLISTNLLKGVNAMMYEFCTYSDETLVTFSNIIKNENGDEFLYVHFERPTDNGFDSIRFELPTYKIVYQEGNYTKDEIKLFKSVVERGAQFFYEWSRRGGIQIA